MRRISQEVLYTTPRLLLGLLWGLSTVAATWMVCALLWVRPEEIFPEALAGVLTVTVLVLRPWLDGSRTAHGEL